MKLEAGYLLGLYLQRAIASSTSLLSTRDHDLSNYTIDAWSNASTPLCHRSDGSGDVHMGGTDDQDYISRGSPARSPSPAQDPVLPELTDGAALQLIQKGAKLYGWISEPDTQRLTQVLRHDNKLGPDDQLQSRFMNYPQDLVDAGWQKDPTDTDRDSSSFETGVPLKAMVDGLALSKTWSIPPNQRGDNQYVTWWHTNKIFDGTDHRLSTNAFYSSTYNSKDGIIYFVSNYGPKTELPTHAWEELRDECSEEDVDSFIREYQYPRLGHVSDVSALEYNNQCLERGHSARDLSKLVMLGSQSKQTVRIVDYLLKKKGVEPMAKSRRSGRYKAPDWAHRMTYQPGSDEFNLLMANENGNLATFLLMQHRQKFGSKHVSKIDVFDDDHYQVDPEEGYKGATMVYYLEDLDNQGKSVVKVGASGSGSGKKPPKHGGSAGKPSRIGKPKTSGGRQGLRPGSIQQGRSKL